MNQDNKLRILSDQSIDDARMLIATCRRSPFIIIPPKMPVRNYRVIDLALACIYIPNPPSGTYTNRDAAHAAWRV